MFKTIIWATDGSEAADRAFPYAKELVDDGGRIVVFHVRELLVGRAGGQPVYADEEEIEARIRDRAEQLREEGFEVTLKWCTTFDVNPAHSIAVNAKELGADAIVVGTRGRGPFTSALLGSVTQRLLHDAECVIVAVPPHVRVEEPELV